MSDYLNKLYKIITQNKYLNNALKEIKEIDSEDIYIGSGAITQTVWNYLFGNDLTYGIDDFDIVYFNDNDLNENAENKMIREISNKLKNIPIKLDIKNQARVHLWYRNYFGYDILPITSIEDAIDRWPTTSTSIGIKLNEKNEFYVYAPFGFKDLFSGIVRANKRQITKEIYDKKVQKWIKKWPKLKVIPWN
jgi:hypothetical protein